MHIRTHDTIHHRHRQCDNYNLKSHRRCNDIVSYEFLWIRNYIRSNVHYCVLFSSRIRVRIRFRVWLV